MTISRLFTGHTITCIISIVACVQAASLIWDRELPPPSLNWSSILNLKPKRGPVVNPEWIKMNPWTADTRGVYINVGNSDKLMCLDAANGSIKWSFFANGPIRWTPIIAQDKVYVAADDGNVYCLNSATGALVWKFNATPSNRKVLGEDRLISLWAIKGAPVLDKGVIYFAAGMWPMEGVFIYALNAETGKIIWLNDNSDSKYDQLPHSGSKGFRGVTPYGYCGIIGDTLAIANGYNCPAYFMRSNGKLSSFPFQQLINSANPPQEGIVGGGFYNNPAAKTSLPKDRMNAGGFDFVMSANKISCYAETGATVAQHTLQKTAVSATSQDAVQTAQNILTTTGKKDLTGYCVVLGLKDGQLVEALTQNSSLRIIAIDSDGAKVNALRKKFDAAGLYGKKVHAITGNPMSADLPPYLAQLVTSEDPGAAGISQGSKFAKTVFSMLRPYGGTACFTTSADVKAQIEQWVTQEKLAKAKVSYANGLTTLMREGSLPGAGDWTHTLSDPGASMYCKDSLAKGPLGILWFGSEADQELEVEAKTTPLVCDGRVFINKDLRWIFALDVYTGQRLWKADLPTHSGLENIPMVVTHDAFYALVGKTCIRYNPATGAKINEFVIPAQRSTINWASMAIKDDYLVAQFGTKESDKLVSDEITVVNRNTGAKIWSKKAAGGYPTVTLIDWPNMPHYPWFQGNWYNTFAVSSNRVFIIDGFARICAFDLTNGTEVWSKSQQANSLVYSDVLDLVCVSNVNNYFAKPRFAATTNKTMIAYNGTSGAVAWSNTAFEGTWPFVLHKDKVICCPNKYAYYNQGGTKIYDIRTGKPFEYNHPVTGKKIAQTFTRTHGCGMVAAADNIATFRSGNHGYIDPNFPGGTANFGGCRPNCHISAVPANGVVSNVVRTECFCYYPFRPTLCMIERPHNELWTLNPTVESGQIGAGIQRLGINFNAPGARRAKNGIVWYEYPPGANKVGKEGKPVVPLTIESSNPVNFRNHCRRVIGQASWVCASGIEGVSRISIPVNNSSSTSFTVRLYFMEPRPIGAGKRVFSVSLNGQSVLDDFDIVKEAGTIRFGIVKTFKDISIPSDLTLSFSAADGSQPPIISGIEIIDSKLPIEEVPTSIKSQKPSTGDDPIALIPLPEPVQGNPAALKATCAIPASSTNAAGYSAFRAGLSLQKAEGLPKTQTAVPVQNAFDPTRFIAAFSSGQGTILRERWYEIPGDAVTSLTSDIAYSTKPDAVDQLDKCAVLPGDQDNFGTRIRGYVHPGQSGPYTFHLSGDDDAELWLSTSDDPAVIERIASLPAKTESDEWHTFAAQQSHYIPLESGRKYYIEILHKEADGDDHVAAAWTRPDGTFEIIDGSALSPFTLGAGCIIREYWAGIGGTELIDLQESGYYPKQPTGREILNSLTFPENWADNFGARAAGYLIPPQSDEYLFRLEGGDECSLVLRTISPEGAGQVVVDLTTSQSAESSPVKLVGGRPYYIEAVQKAGTGNDFLRVLWKKADDAKFAPVGGAALSPLTIK